MNIYSLKSMMRGFYAGFVCHFLLATSKNAISYYQPEISWHVNGIVNNDKSNTAGNFLNLLESQMNFIFLSALLGGMIGLIKGYLTYQPRLFQMPQPIFPPAMPLLQPLNDPEPTDELKVVAKMGMS